MKLIKNFYTSMLVKSLKLCQRVDFFDYCNSKVVAVLNACVKNGVYPHGLSRHINVSPSTETTYFLLIEERLLQVYCKFMIKNQLVTKNHIEETINNASFKKEFQQSMINCAVNSFMARKFNLSLWDFGSRMDVFIKTECYSLSRT